MSYGPARKPAIDRFMAMTFICHGHWLWTGPVTERGYGIFRDYDQHLVRAHRWSYSYFKGPIPEGELVRHQCDITICTNPECLLTGTQAQNQQDMITRGRLGKRSEQARFNGRRNLRADHDPMTAEKVCAILNMHETGVFSQDQLAAMFRASQTIISRVVRGKYSHLS